MDNAHNHILSNRESQSSVVTEQEQTGVIVEPLVKAEHLLVSGQAAWGPGPSAWKTRAGQVSYPIRKW